MNALAIIATFALGLLGLHLVEKRFGKVTKFWLCGIGELICAPYLIAFGHSWQRGVGIAGLLCVPILAYFIYDESRHA